MAGEILNPMPENPAQTYNPADTWHFAQQRARVRSHVIHSGHSAHHLRVFQLRNPPAGSFDDFFQPFVRSALRKIIGIDAALAVEISDQKFVVRVGAEISGGDRIDAGATAALHVRSVFEDCNLVILGFDGQIDPDVLEKRPRPWAGGGDYDGRGNFALSRCRLHALRPPLDQEFDRLSFGQVIDAKLAGAGEEIVCDSGAVAIAGVGFVSGQFDFIDLPVRLQFFEFVTIDKASH